MNSLRSLGTTRFQMCNSQLLWFLSRSQAPHSEHSVIRMDSLAVPDPRYSLLPVVQPWFAVALVYQHTIFPLLVASSWFG